jgi:hypothetical protein
LKLVRTRLTYANVMSTIALVLALGGATAFAAVKLGPNTIGARQLKANAVTAAKIKAGAVNTSEIANGAVGGAQLSAGDVSGNKIASGAVSGDKIADGAITTGKLADGSVTASKIDPAALPGSSVGVAQRIVSTTSLAFPNTPSPSVSYQFDNPTFVQPAGEDDLYAGSITVRFPPECKAPREFTAILEEANPLAIGGFRVVARALGEDHSGTGQTTVTAAFGGIDFGATALVAPPSPLSHTLDVSLDQALCATGSPASATATAIGAQVDVIGVR